MRPLQIVVADDHVFLRDLIVANLEQTADRHAVVAVVETAAAAVEACVVHQPDLLVLDYNLPGRRQVGVISTLRRTAPAVHVLLCTSIPGADRCKAAIRLGARGFVEKTESWAEFLEAIDRVGRGEQYFSARNSTTAVARAARQRSKTRKSATQLSEREKEVVRLIVTGSTSKEIASQLFLSPATVEKHRVNVMTKLGLRNVAGLVHYAIQAGLVRGGI